MQTPLKVPIGIQARVFLMWGVSAAHVIYYLPHAFLLQEYNWSYLVWDFKQGWAWIVLGLWTGECLVAMGAVRYCSHMGALSRVPTCGTCSTLLNRNLGKEMDKGIKVRMELLLLHIQNLQLWWFGSLDGRPPFPPGWTNLHVQPKVCWKNHFCYPSYHRRAGQVGRSEHLWCVPPPQISPIYEALFTAIVQTVLRVK